MKDEFRRKTFEKPYQWVWSNWNDRYEGLNGKIKKLARRKARRLLKSDVEKYKL